VFEPRKLGYISTLIAAQVDPERLPEIAVAMLSTPEITHNYVRDNEWNLWFTITAQSPERLENIITWFKEFPGVKGCINLPVIRVYKVNAVWGLENPFCETTENGDGEPAVFDDARIDLVRALQQEFPILENPFRLIAGKIKWDIDEVLETIRGWIADGTIRRFGARLDHRKMGYTTNVLTVWDGENIDLWGEKFAMLDNISHCYRREPNPNWTYELYAMVHARSDSHMQKTIKTMRKNAPGAKMIRLKTRYELKKTVMKYFIEE
jgi:DNA-binding Lrp family transcriptional regulator